MAGSGLRFSFGVRAWTEMEIQCVEGKYRLKLVSCKNNSGFKGLSMYAYITLHRRQKRLRECIPKDSEPDVMRDACKNSLLPYNDQVLYSMQHSHKVKGSTK